MRLGRQLAKAGKEVICLVYRTARVHHEGGAGDLVAGEAHLGHQPVEEGEDLVKGREALTVGGKALIDGAVTPAHLNGP